MTDPRPDKVIPFRARPTPAPAAASMPIDTGEAPPRQCGTSPHGWPVHVYRIGAALGDPCLCGAMTVEVVGR